MTAIKDELAKRASNIKEGNDREIPESHDETETNASDSGGTFVRLLRAEEIECRVSMVNEKGLSLLLFKDARVDQKILDETFTPFGWKRTHQDIDGSLYCTVEIWDDAKRQWVAKQDVGTASYSEKEKGQASDSFKRACFNWGIGRELYTAPFIWVPVGIADIRQKGDRYVTSDKFYVQSIAYNGQREIVSLVIANGRGTQVFSKGQGKKYGQATATGGELEMGKAQGAGVGQDSAKKPDAKQRIKKEESMWSPGMMEITDKQMAEMKKELERTGVSIEAVLARYQLQSIGQITPKIYRKAMDSLRLTKTKVAA